MDPQNDSARTDDRPPAAWYQRINHIGVPLAWLGLAPRDAVTLEVGGRTSGTPGGNMRRRRPTSVIQPWPAGDESALQTLRMYYVAQYDRVGRHESNRLTFSNYVIAASFVALGLLASPESKQGLLKIPGGTPRITLTASIALANIFGILFAVRSRYWVRIHLARVRSALEYLSPELVTIQAKADEKAGRRKKDPASTHSHVYQSCIHGLVIAAALSIGVLL